MNKNILSAILLLFTFNCFSQENTLEIPTEHISYADYASPLTKVEAESYFQEIVGTMSADEFATSYLEMAQNIIGTNAEYIQISMQYFYYEIVIDNADRDSNEDIRDLTSRSYTRKVWVKKANNGDVLEVGSSEIKSGDQEQEVFYFRGPLNAQGHFENW